jgi:hypothetical protein
MDSIKAKISECFPFIKICHCGGVRTYKYGRREVLEVHYKPSRQKLELWAKTVYQVRGRDRKGFIRVMHTMVDQIDLLMLKAKEYENELVA